MATMLKCALVTRAGVVTPAAVMPLVEPPFKVFFEDEAISVNSLAQGRTKLSTKG